MIIILDVTDSNANRVESYNDGETLLVTPNVFEAIDEAAFTAEAHEAVVRLRVGDRLGHVEITTSPRALRLKTRSLQSVAFLLRYLVGMPGLARSVNRAAATGTFGSRTMTAGGPTRAPSAQPR
jgi:hypothetical protein